MKRALLPPLAPLAKGRRGACPPAPPSPAFLTNRCNKRYLGSTKTTFQQRFNVYKSYIRTYAHKYNEGSLDRGKAVLQASFFGHFLSEGHQGAFSVSIKIIDGASDVYSLRRMELFWHHKLGTFAPNGLNERAADIELDMFSCGTA